MRIHATLLDRASPTSTVVLVAVAIGGAIGAGGRWAVSELFGAVAGTPPPGAWQWPTLLVNVVGAFAIGLAAGRLDRHTVAWAFAATGVLGGFTTYSSFAVDVDQLAAAGRSGLAALYAGVTILAGAAAVAVATSVARRRTAHPEATRR